MQAINQKTSLQLVVVSFFAASLFAINFGLGAAITLATGTPGASGLVTGFTTALTMYIACYVLGTRWSGAAVFGLYCFAAWPTVLMGPPGSYKIITGIFAGASFGYLLRYGKSETDQSNTSWILSITSWGAFTASIIAGTYIFFHFLNLPGKDRFLTAMWIFAFIFFVLGLFGIAVARAVAKKLNNTETFKMLRAVK